MCSYILQADQRWHFFISLPGPSKLGCTFCLAICFLSSGSIQESPELCIYQHLLYLELYPCLRKLQCKMPLATNGSGKKNLRTISRILVINLTRYKSPRRQTSFEYLRGALDWVELGGSTLNVGGIIPQAGVLY